jgi:hypothetical protein
MACLTGGPLLVVRLHPFAIFMGLFVHISVQTSSPLFIFVRYRKEDTLERRSVLFDQPGILPECGIEASEHLILILNGSYYDRIHVRARQFFIWISSSLAHCS